MEEKNLEKNQNTSKRDSKNTKRVRKTKKKILLLIVIILIICIVIITVVKKNKNRVKPEIECNQLEKIGLSYYINTINIKYFNTMENTMLLDIVNKQIVSSQDKKINYAINICLDTDANNLNDEQILKVYKDIFEDDGITPEQVHDFVTRQHIMSFDSQTGKYALDKNITRDTNKEFVVLKNAKQIGENQYKIKLDVVDTVDREKLMSYYSKSENIEKAKEINLKDLYKNIQSTNKNEEAKSQTELLKYATKENYEDIAKEVKNFSFTVKTENETIKILDID